MKTLTTKHVSSSVAEMINVDDMIKALQKLPKGSKLCVRKKVSMLKVNSETLLCQLK